MLVESFRSFVFGHIIMSSLICSVYNANVVSVS